jgi:hypothetical protein
MIKAAQRRTSMDTRMLAAADRLFREFDELPVGVVFRTIGCARSTVRDRDGVAIPEAVEELARDELLKYAAKTSTVDLLTA